VTFINFKMS